MTTASDLLVVASIVAGFGVAIFAFRLSREVEMERQGELTWIPWADRLIIGATLISLLTVIAPIIVLGSANPRALCVARASILMSLILVAGYIPSILAHYRLLCGRRRRDSRQRHWAMAPEWRDGPRTNPEPAECVLVLVTVALGVAAFFATLLFVG
jgi:hypothetical protein